MNFKDMYKAANEQIHAPTEALNKVLAATYSKPKKVFSAAKICAAAAAVIALALSSVYFSGTKTENETTKLIQADTNKQKADSYAEIPQEESKQYEQNGNTETENEKTSDRTYSSSAYAPVQNRESAPVSEEKPAQSEKSEALTKNDADVYKESDHTLPEASAENSVDSISEDNGEPVLSMFSLADDSGQDKRCGSAASAMDNGYSESLSGSFVSYEEYCDIIGYDVVAKAKLPDGVSLEKPDELFVDGAQNTNTFCTASETAKECYITVSAADSIVVSNEVKGESDTFEISIQTENVSIYASAYGFTKTEADALAASLAE